MLKAGVALRRGGAEDADLCIPELLEDVPSAVKLYLGCRTRRQGLGFLLMDAFYAGEVEACFHKNNLLAILLLAIYDFYPERPWGFFIIFYLSNLHLPLTVT